MLAGNSVEKSDSSNDDAAHAVGVTADATITNGQMTKSRQGFSELARPMVKISFSLAEEKDACGTATGAHFLLRSRGQH